tara:strand:+ start:1962 stop:2192 length:231 start_codon:yes stop_codon:yes gene_type:complete
MNRKYVIIKREEVEDIDFSQVVDTSAETLRFSTDGSKTFVKYEGSKPPCLEGKPALTYDQMLSKLSTDKWNPPIDE